MLLCVQLSPNRKIQSEINALLRQPIDWKAFEDDAMWHGVSSLAFNGLRCVQDRNLLPNPLFEKLKSEYKKNWVRNTIIFLELDRLVALLDKAKIPTILLKGAAINRMIYGDIGLKPMSDIDILVKKEDLNRVSQVLETSGYCRSGHQNLEHLLKVAYHVSFFNPENDVLLEIHWHITAEHHPVMIRSNTSDLIEKCWFRASRWMTGYDSISHLHPIDLICMLSIHFIKHRLAKNNEAFSSKGGLLQLLDILNVIRFYKDEMAWSDMSAELHRLGMYRVVCVVLWIVKAFFHEITGDRIALFNKLSIDHTDKQIALIMAERISKMKDRHIRVPRELIRCDQTPLFSERIEGMANRFFIDPASLSERLNKPINSKWFYLNYISRFFYLFKRYGEMCLNKEHVNGEKILKQWVSGKI